MPVSPDMEKALLPIVVTLSGIVMAVSLPQAANALGPISVKPFPNVTFSICDIENAFSSIFVTLSGSAMLFRA
jgi:hypothetical protein